MRGSIVAYVAVNPNVTRDYITPARMYNHVYLHWEKIQSQNSKSEAIRNVIFQIPPPLTVGFYVGPVSN